MTQTRHTSWPLDELVRDLTAYLDSRHPHHPGTIPEGCRLDVHGHLMREGRITDAAQLEDQTTRTIAAYGYRLACEVSRYRAYVMRDVAAHLEIVAEQYGAPRRGRRGNVTLRSACGRVRVTVQTADRIALGPELQAACAILDDLRAEWAAEAHPDLRTLIDAALTADDRGQVSVPAVLRLRRARIEDPRWRAAMRAIDDAIRVVGSRSYARIHIRPSVDDGWEAVPISLASDWVDPSVEDLRRDPVDLRGQYEALARGAPALGADMADPTRPGSCRPVRRHGATLTDSTLTDSPGDAT